MLTFDHSYKKWGGWDTRLVIAKEDLECVHSVEFSLFEQGMSASDFYPKTAKIYLAELCNLRCQYCAIYGRQKVIHSNDCLISWDIIKEVTRQFKEIHTLKRISLLGHGETFLNPEWYEMTQYMLENTKIAELEIYTNGTLLSDDNIEKLLNLSCEKIKLSVSIDGRSSMENDVYRVGASYANISFNVRNLLEKCKETEKIRVIIRNCFVLRPKDIKQGDIYSGSKKQIAPEFLRNDFPDVEIFSVNTFVRKTRVMNTDILDNVEVFYPENEKIGCIVPFTELTVDAKGQLLRCSCGLGQNVICSVFDNDILCKWYKDPFLEQVRNNFLKKKPCLDLCYSCSDNKNEKFFLMIDKP